MRLIVILLAVIVPSVAFGATKTWTGAGADANWGTSANWMPAGAPVANDDLVFTAAAAQQSNNNNTALFSTYRSITVEGGTYTFGGNPLRLTNGMVISTGTQTFNFAITLSGAQTFLADNGGTATIVILSIGSNTLTIDGAGIVGIGLISGSGAVIKNGAGVGAIIAATSFSGPITLNNGIFVVDANIPSSNVSVNSPTTGGFALSGFGGTGTVGAVNVTQGAVSAGTLTSPTGVLNISNGLTFTANGLYACKLSGTTPGANGHDQLNVTGAVNLNNAQLAPIPWAGFRPAVGDTFVIVRNDGSDPINGIFLNLPNDTIFAGPLNSAFKISYVGGDGNDIAIQRVARAPFDFDGDGKTDVATFSLANARWDVLPSSGGSPSSTFFGLVTDAIAPADYDGDNRTDIATFRDGAWWIMSSRTSTVTSTSFGLPGDKPVPNDFDGDGRADLAVFRPSNGTWYQLRSLGNQPFAQQFGANGDIPQMADVDGDGLGDLAVYRPTGGEWHFYRSSDNSYLAFPFGLSTDKPVMADYDGDGKSDVAVFRATNDSNLPDFYILLTNGYVYYGSSWGVVGDVPTVGDYDGDGKSDIAVYRPDGSGTATWYLLRSTAGFTSVNFGTPSSKPVPSAYIP